MRISVKVPNSNGVTPGQTAVWDLPIGRRYHSLQLEYSGVTLAQMSEIRIVANGEVIQRYSAAERDSINQYDGRAAAAGILVLPFDRFALYQQKGEEATAIQTGSADPKSGVAITNFKLEIDLVSAVYTPSIKITAEQSDNDPKNPGPGLILRVMKYAYAFGAAGENEISDLPKGTEGPKFLMVNRAIFKAANITNLKLERSNFVIFDRSKALNERRQVDGVRAPQAGYVVFDPTEEGYDFEPVALVAPNGQPYQDFRYKLQMSGGETVTALIEYLGTLQG